MARGDGTSGNLVARMSVSLPEHLLVALDSMVEARGFASRSQAISDMLHQSLLEHQREYGHDVTVGTITLFYDNSVTGLQKKLADLQAENIDEVISSLHVHLMGNQTLEVILVQGPPADLQRIADEMITLRGVISGRMELIAAIIPQLHPLPKERTKRKHATKRDRKSV
ncbi:nickel-responsive transcriptional regulator NikR [Hyphomicrobium sp. CS1GBMeth3]|uniref:nickel-responsive transcriptional regulator NikR n=1 Tax=Hyphomicrobium sp. CS1GBMeth3 TaxID=1892845 RepID=UPI0009301E6B|nr:nickel-responsive transcriptional regulator NikR [Hyphomicrobium sp. CS1GBMeth3]